MDKYTMLYILTSGMEIFFVLYGICNRFHNTHPLMQNDNPSISVYPTSKCGSTNSPIP